jgi:xanthine dehydrogenase accessory factor
MPGIDQFFGRVAALRREGESFAVATVVARRAPVSSHMGDRAIVFADGRMEGFVGGSCSREIVRHQALDAIRTGSPRLVQVRPDAEPGDDGESVVVPMSCGSKGAVDVYIEPFVRARTVLVVGLTPVAEAIAKLSATLEYAVVRVVGRDELRDVGDAERVVPLEELASFLDELPASARSSLDVVVASQGHYDEPALEAVLRSDPAYVGLVASGRRADEVRTVLRGMGVSDSEVARLRAPAGVGLGARNPGEVALSILAELIRLRPSPRAVGSADAFADAEVAAPQTVLDPVCGMEVPPGKNAAEHDGQTYSFCCPGCRQRFLSEPARFLEHA